MSSRFPLNLIDNKFMPFLLRVILSGVFIYAAAGKILYPAEFSEAIANYQLVPLATVNLIAIILPWIEFTAALCLLNGFKTHSANLIVFFCLGIFTIGAITALIRGLDINCGCFSESSRRVGLIFLIEEFIMLLMSLSILYFDKGFFSIDNLLHKYASS